MTTYHFTDIEYDFTENDNLILRAFANDATGEYEIEEDWLRDTYHQEFIETVYKQPRWDCPPEDVPTGRILTLHEWAAYYLHQNKKRMWYLWNLQPADKLVILEP